MYLKSQKWLYWTKVANVWVGMDKIPCSGGSQMGEHGPHVNWRFLEKLFWARSPTGINKIRIPHYFRLFNNSFGYIFLSCSSHVFVIKFLFIHILHIVFLFLIFLFYNLHLKLSMPSFMCFWNLVVYFFLCLWYILRFIIIWCKRRLKRFC